MKVYTSIEYRMTDEGLEEVASESFDYEGPVAETKGGGGGQPDVTYNYYYGGGTGEMGPAGPAGPPGPAGPAGLEGIAGLPGAEDPMAGAGLTPSGYAMGPDTGANLGPSTPMGPTSTTAIAPPSSYTNPYDLMNTIQPPNMFNQG